MSNEEKKRLEEYLKRRTKWIIIQISILACLALIFVGLVFTYQSIDKTYYVTYTENSSIDYKVKLKENNIYEEEYLGEEYSYVSAIVDSVIATFKYNLEIDAEKVSYDFTTKADALVQIVDSATNNAVYKKGYNLLPSNTQKIETNKLSLPLQLDIDYDIYDAEVKKVVDTLGLKSYKASLIVNVTYYVESECRDFDSNNNSHTLTLTIPLDETVFKITESQTVPTIQKTIACEKIVQKDTVKTAAIIVLVLAIICLLILICFVYFTRNTHINYSNKVKKIVNAYKSFIHRINNRFDTTGYQVLFVSTIKELLEIRDTLQSPILMCENEDKTMTEFIVPTSNNLLYVFEIKIENYDEIYGLAKEDSNDSFDNKEVCELKEETIEELEVVDASLVEEDDDEDEESDDELRDNNEFYDAGFPFSNIVRKPYKKFIDRMKDADEQTKEFYNIIKNELLSYKGIKSRISKKCESFKLGRILEAKLKVSGTTLKLYLSLDPNEFDRNIYHHRDASDKKMYQEVPLLMRLRSRKSVKKSLELIKIMMEKGNVSRRVKYEAKDYLIELFNSDK